MVRYCDSLDYAVNLIYDQLGAWGDVKSLFAPLVLTRIYVNTASFECQPYHEVTGQGHVRSMGRSSWYTKSPDWVMSVMMGMSMRERWNHHRVSELLNRRRVLNYRVLVGFFMPCYFSNGRRGLLAVLRHKEIDRRRSLC